MIDTDRLTTYVIEHFRALMTPVEQIAHRHLSTVHKMTAGRSRADAWREVCIRMWVAVAGCRKTHTCSN